MSLNDFETVLAVDADEVIITKIGGAVRAALAAKEDLTYAMSEAIDASTTFGYELGSEDAFTKIIEAVQLEIESVATMVDIEFLDGLARALDIIKNLNVKA